MNRKALSLFTTAIGAAIVSAPSPVAAQAFTPPKGLGAVTLVWQYIDNTGHRLGDGYFVARGQSVTTSAALELEYGVTDRLTAALVIPYVFAKYTGAMPAPSQQPVDLCGCWHSAFQDFSLGARYRFGGESWAVTPHGRYIRPSHDYLYRGEAVVGANLEQAQVGLSTAARFKGFLSRASAHAGYTYSFGEKPLPDVSISRSSGSISLGYGLTSSLYAHAGGNWLHTHGGLTRGAPLQPGGFPTPGEFNTPERRAQADRLLQTRYWQVAGGLSYSLGAVDVFASVTKYVWGRNAHNGQAYNAGVTWYFEFPR